MDVVREGVAVLRVLAPDGRAVETIVVPSADVIVGRSDECPVCIDHPSVSRHHARLHRGPHGWVLHDLSSTHGVYRDGRRIERCVLQPGDRFALGAVHLEWDLVDRRRAPTVGLDPGPGPGRALRPVAGSRPAAPRSPGRLDLTDAAWAPAGALAPPRPRTRSPLLGLSILVVGLAAAGAWLVVTGWVADAHAAWSAEGMP